MQNPKPFPTVRFFSVALVLMFLLYGVNPLMETIGLDAYRYPKEARAFSDKIVEFTPQHVADMSQSSSRPLMLHVYASWCPYCQQQNPIIAEIIKERSNRLDVVMLAVDNNKYRLSQYLMKLQQPLPYTPYIMPDRAYPSLMKRIVSSGGQFDGGIPYTAIFNESGKIVAQFPGLVQKTEIEAGIELAQ